MSVKVVFIAHPISGNVEDNIAKILNIIRNINIIINNVIPYAPYISDCLALNDDNKRERMRGIANSKELFKRGIIDEIWLYGECISNGMKDEIKLANELNIPIIPKSSLISNQMVRDIING